MSKEYGDIFEIELKCWCLGLQRCQSQVDRSVLFKVIKQFAPVLREAVEHLYVCDVLDTARKLVVAAKCRISEKEIAFYILSHLPAPTELNREQADTLIQIVDQVEQSYCGAVKRMEQKWNAAQPQKWKKQAKGSSALESLSFPSKPY